MPGGEYWDKYVHVVGHTSYRDAMKRRYDRPLRMKAIRKHLEWVRARQPQQPQGNDALEFGCGEGDIVALLRDQRWNVTGIDVSADVISIARERFVNDSRVQFFQSESGRLPADLGNFEICTAIDVFQNIESDESVVELLSLIRSKIGPRGRILTLEIATSAKLVNPDARMRERTPDEWRDIYRKAGLQIEKETVYALWGITLIQQFDRLLGKMQSGNGQPTSDGESAEAVSRRTGLGRWVARLAVRNIRRAILIGSWPIDYVLRIPAPRRWAFHGIFVLKISD